MGWGEVGEWSRVEWSGVESSRMRWGGVKWKSGVE